MTIQLYIQPLILALCSDQQEPVPLSVRHRTRRLRKSVEGRAEEGEEALRHERDGKSPYNFKAQCELCHE